MAFESSQPLKLFPTAATGLSLAAGAGTTAGAWTQVWASAPAALTVVGFAINKGAAGVTDIQLGIGPGGSEVVIASERYSGNPASQRLNGSFIVPVTIAAGTRVALRTRISAAEVGLQYFEANDSDNVTVGGLDAIDVVPIVTASVINGVVVVPGDSWAWGSYVELTSGIASAIGISGLIFDARRSEEYEWQIAIGAASSEVPVATFASFVSTIAEARQEFLLPAIRRIPENTRVAVRARTSSNSGFSGTHRATLLYYTGVGTVPDPDPDGTPDAGTDPDAGISLCGAETVIPWVTVQTDGGEKVYAFDDVALDTVHKEARLISGGVITRALSSMEGALETATQAIELSDHDRALRAAADAGTLLNKRVDTYLSTRPGVIAGAIPRRVNQGIIRRYKALPNLRFRLEVEDFFSTLYNSVKGQKVLPQRVLTLDDFPNLPDTAVGKAVPILYGLCSDEDQGANALGVVPATYVGIRTLGGTFAGDWREFVVCGHAVKQIQSAFTPTGGGLSTGTPEPSRTKITTDQPDVLIPGMPFYTAQFGADPFQDYNGNRYCTVFMRGPLGDFAAEGRVPLALNVAGIETDGDGTGDLIGSLPRQLQHLIVNFMLTTYTNGSWSNIPAVPVTPPYSRVSSATFETVHAHTVARLPSDGYQGAFMLGWEGQFHAWRDVIRDALTSGAFNLGINKDGQIIAAIRDPGAAVVKHWDHVLDILDGSFDADRDFAALANRVEYRYAQRYVAPVATLTPATGDFLPASIKQDVKDWLGENYVQNAASIAALASDGDDGVRTYPIVMPWVRAAGVADNVAAQILVERKAGPITATHAVNLCGTDVELGQNQTVTHFEGPTATGWTAQLLRVERMALDLDGARQAFGQRDHESITP